MKKLILFTIIIVQTLSLKPWYLCRDFKKTLHFSPHQLKLTIDDAIHNDQNMSLWLVRFFHNKLIFASIDILKRFLLFWDIGFLVNLISPLGTFGLIYGFYHLLDRGGSMSFAVRKRYCSFFVVGYLLFVPLSEILFWPKINFLIKILYLIVPIQLFALFGWEQFLKKEKASRFFLVVIIIWLSIYWQTGIEQEMGLFCHKI